MIGGDMSGMEFVSENTINLLSLHDCDCARLSYQNDSLIFEMEWMEVLAAHPLNPHKKAYQSGPGRIILESPTLTECVLGKKLPVQGENVTYSLTQIEEISFENIEFLEYNELQTEQGFLAKMFLIFYDRESEFGNLSLEVQFRKSIVMWNELKEESWFERDGKHELL